MIAIEIGEIRERLDQESRARMDNIFSLAVKASDASNELERISFKLQGLSALFVIEDAQSEIRLDGDEANGFAFLLQDVSHEIKAIAERLEGGKGKEV